MTDTSLTEAWRVWSMVAVQGGRWAQEPDVAGHAGGATEVRRARGATSRTMMGEIRPSTLQGHKKF